MTFCSMCFRRQVARLSASRRALSTSRLAFARVAEDHSVRWEELPPPANPPVQPLSSSASTSSQPQRRDQDEHGDVNGDFASGSDLFKHEGVRSREIREGDEVHSIGKRARDARESRSEASIIQAHQYSSPPDDWVSAAFGEASTPPRSRRSTSTKSSATASLNDVISEIEYAEIDELLDAKIDGLATESPSGPATSSTSTAPSESTVELAEISEQSRSANQRPRRRTEVSDLPPIPPDQPPPVELARYDWRKRALSRTGKALGNRWYPSKDKKRVFTEFTKLGYGDKYGEELERYLAHFRPLLDAENRDAWEVFMYKIREWSLEKLEKEGHALSRMTAAKARTQHRSRSIIEFTRRDKRDKPTSLPYTLFAPGKRVMLSRTNPLIDPAEKVQAEDDKKPSHGGVHAYVVSATQKYIKVSFESEIEGIENGVWRIDLGMDDYVHRCQVRALTNIHLNPFEQEEADALMSRQNTVFSPVNAPFPEDWDMELQEQTVLQGTGLRDILLKAFQEDFVPYASIASTLPVASSTDSNDPTDGGKTDTEAVTSTETVAVTVTETASSTSDQHSQTVDIPAEHMDPIEEVASSVPTNLHTQASGVLSHDQLIQSWAKRYKQEGEVVRSDGDPEVPLNASQVRAIAMMLSERLSLVQGPPGTGKTRVIIETIKLLKQHWQIPHPILVTAHTNVAVDNLLAGLRGKGGVNAVRYGPTERVRPDLLQYTFDHLSRQHPLHSEIDRLESEKEAFWARDHEGNLAVELSETRKERLAEISKKLYKMRTELHRDVLLDADVICTTCLSATSGFILKQIDFPIVFLDEASMATEPLSLVPLMKGSSHVAIIGDHKQLPPVIISEAARFGGLATSLFERLIHEKHVPTVMLDTQYRMHPAIAAFPSQAFYNDNLKNGTVTPDGRPLPRYEPPQTSYLYDAQDRHRNVMFIDHDFPESPESRSLANYGDAEKVADIVVDLLYNNPDLSGDDIGIIAPYAAQIRLLHAYLNTDPLRLAAMADVLGPARAMEIGNVEIKTVDGFEGREKAVIVFSTVRSNSGGWIGFLADWRRLNVGITRAKRGLIIVGSADTLGNAKIGTKAEDHLPNGGTDVWKEFIQHLRSEGQILKVK